MKETLSEFELIAQYFSRSNEQLPSTDTGVGDDAAIVSMADSNQMAIATDTMVVNRHFLPEDTAESVGWKALAVNLSDIAAMGAKPCYALLALTLPTVDTQWLEAFSKGLYDCCQSYEVALVGGDTTRGPLCVTVTVVGEVLNRPILRSQANVGDDVWVSGALGLAALGLRLKQNPELIACRLFKERCLTALEKPIPRVELGKRLSAIASAMIDVSDGLISDLGHIADQSNLKAVLSLEYLLAIESELLDHIPDKDLVMTLIGHGGEDYELCFTAKPEYRSHIEHIGNECQIPLHRIGHTAPGKGVTLLSEGRPIPILGHGFDHFLTDDVT